MVVGGGNDLSDQNLRWAYMSEDTFSAVAAQVDER